MVASVGSCFTDQPNSTASPQASHWTMPGNQVLPDGHGIPATTESLLDQCAERLAGTGSPILLASRSEIGWPKSVVTSLAGFASEGSMVTSLAGFDGSRSVVTPMAGFDGARRPHPGRHTTTPADFR